MLVSTSFGSPWGLSLGDFGAVKKKASSATASRAAVKRLQAALVSLGKVVKSATLKSIKVDGAIGAKTIAAVNLTFTHHLGPGQAPAQYRTGKLSKSTVLGEIGNLTALIEAEIQRRGAKAASVSTAKKAELVKAVKAAPVPVTKEIAKRLQRALADLGSVVNSKSLKKIKADGAIGKLTVAAVNLTFTHHLGPGQAPAAFRTGNLSIDTVKGQAGELAKYIEAEAARRRAKAKAGAPAQITAADKAAAARIPTSKAAAKDLQNELVNLGKTVRDSVLKKIKVDGAIGPATVAAVNRAFTKHIGAGQAPAQFRTGALSLTAVKQNITQLIQLIHKETRRRGGAALIPTTTTVPVKTKTGRIVQVKYKGKDTYQVTEPTGKTYDTKAPTEESPPDATPPEPITEEEEEVAAEEVPEKATVKKASKVTSKAVSKVVIPPPTEEDEEVVGPTQASMFPAAGLLPSSSTFEKYKLPLLIGTGIAVLGIGFMAMRRHQAGFAPEPRTQTRRRR